MNASSVADVDTGHRASHRSLLRALTTDPATRSSAPLLDAVVMPTNRRLDEPRSGVALAARLAAELGERGPRPTVVLLCSGAARSEHLPRSLFAGTRVLTVDLGPRHRPDWPSLRTDEHILSHYHRRNDVGLKRNLGLQLARTQGWKHVLMLDDDVKRLVTLDGEPGRSANLGVRNVADALTALGEAGTRCVGWTLEQFPDNSVVCHARRLAGHTDQEKFIGGGALLLRCDGDDLPFFPATYNEDWLFLVPFLLGDAGERRALVEGGRVGQEPYPVYLEKRARSEELGDVLGEGLFNLLSLPGNRFRDLSGSYEYWAEVIEGRQQLISDLLTDLGPLAEGPRWAEAPAAKIALKAALDVHLDTDLNWSTTLATYCRQWREDLDVWSDWLATVDRRPAHTLGFTERR